MPTNWKKKITQALSHSAVGLLLPPTVAAAPASWTGAQLCAVSLPTLRWLSIPLPPTQQWGGKVLEPRVGKLEGRTDRATKCLETATNSVPITIPPNHAGDPLLTPGTKSRSSPLPGNLSLRYPCPLKPLLPLSTISCLNSVFSLTPSTPIFSCPILSSPSAPVLETTYFLKKMECVSRKGGLWSSLLGTTEENRDVQPAGEIIWAQRIMGRWNHKELFGLPRPTLHFLVKVTEAQR